MVSDDNGRNSGGHATRVHGHKLSTVVPANITGEDVTHELTGVDLALKLHYLRGVYYFRGRDAIEGLGIGITALKGPMFPWLDTYFPAAGRIRRPDSGRPYIKCNDSGVRIIEASCDQTLDEWFESKDPARHRQLVPHDALGPDLYFSPTVLIQFTRFTCGGMAVGFSWAHALGDAASAANCINHWAQLLAGNPPPEPDFIRDPQIKAEKPAKELAKPLSIKQVKPVGDCWISPSNCRMATVFIRITETKLKQLKSKVSGPISPFEALSALIWQCLARIRAGREPKLVTICRNDASAERTRILSNERMRISTVISEFEPAGVELSELARLIQKQVADEKAAIEELVDGEGGKADYVVYGANLTFVDMEEIDFYELELKGQKPIHVDYSIDGVGDEGAVLVLRGPDKTDGSNGKGGRVVTLIQPEDQVQQLTEMLRCEWGIA